MKKQIIVSRHPATVEWLKEIGFNGVDVITHVEEIEQIDDKVVIGNVPINFAASAYAIIAVGFDFLPETKRGEELTIDYLRQHGRLRGYRVTADVAVPEVLTAEQMDSVPNLRRTPAEIGSGEAIYWA